jgi:glutathione S-transferase
MACCTSPGREAQPIVEEAPLKTAGSTNEITNDFALELMAKHGWDKGLWYFGADFSESNVKLVMYFEYLIEKGKIAKEDVSKVLVDFNGSELSEDGTTWGLDSESWIKFTNGKDGSNGKIPCVALDGKLYSESSSILKMLFEKYEPDATEEVKEAFEKNYALVTQYEDTAVMPLVKHFGWCALNGHKENYQMFVNMSADRITTCCAELNVFMQDLEGQLADKAYFAGSELSAVDCLMMWYPASLYQVISFPVKEKYPNCWAYYQKLVAAPPAGSANYLTGTFPFFCKVIWMLNMSRASGGKHYVGNPMYWGGQAPPSRTCF